MSEFVEECRREWKRLRVPRTIADEMADDLTVDLQEAEADGASVEEVLEAAPATLGPLPPRGRTSEASPGVVRRIGSAIRRSSRWSCSSSPSWRRAPRSWRSWRAPIGSTTPNTSTVFAPGRIIGTAVEGATLWPSNIALNPGRRTVLKRRPTSITIVFGNSGELVVAPARLTIQIAEHTYRSTVTRMAPNTRKSIRIALPAGLPRRFVIRASTRPVPGETNTSNNQAAWRVALPA